MQNAETEPIRVADRAPTRRSIPTSLFAVGVGLTLVFVTFAVVSVLQVPVPALPPILGHPSGSSTPVAATDHLYLTIAFNPASGRDEYFPANFTVPEHATVVITITNFDNGTNPVPATYQQVAGARGGMESVAMAGGSGALVPMSSIPADQITHTLTVMSFGGSSGSMAGGGAGPALNIPVPQASPVDGSPSTVVATVVFDTAGHFVWLCMAPCDPTAMGNMGYMAGTLTVE